MKTLFLKNFQIVNFIVFMFVILFVFILKSLQAISFWNHTTLCCVCVFVYERGSKKKKHFVLLNYKKLFVTFQFSIITTVYNAKRLIRKTFWLEENVIRQRHVTITLLKVKLVEKILLNIIKNKAQSNSTKNYVNIRYIMNR